MFDNAGEKVKGLAKVYFGICVVGSILAGFSVWKTFEAAGRGVMGVICMLIIAGFGTFFGWITSLVYYAIGEAAEKNGGFTPKPGNSTAKLVEIQRSLQTLEKKIDSLQSGANGAAPATEVASPVAEAGHCQHCHSTEHPVWRCNVKSGKTVKQMNLCKDCIEELHATPVD